MTSKRVKQIIGAGVIVVVICGATFVFTRGTTQTPEPVEQTSVFIDEDTKSDASEVKEERTWEEVISSDQPLLRAKTVTYLHSEPFSDADTLIKVPMGAEFNEETTCFIANEALDFSRVTYEGITGYVDLLDTEYVDVAEAEEVEPEDEEGDSSSSGVSIVDTNESEEVEETGDTEEVDTEKPSEEAEATAEPTPTPEVKAEEKEPVQATDNPNVTTKTEAEKQSELQQEALRRLEAAGARDLEVIDGGGLKGTSGNGTHFGDAQ